MKTVLLAIDLQFDFCSQGGALYVQGADQDICNIANLITTHLDSIDSIIMSMDSHQPVHIAQQIYWRNEDGRQPQLFSTITRQDVVVGRWIPQYNTELALAYLTKLEAAGYVCTIWPPHCIIGTEGWTISEKVFKALTQWTISTGIPYEMVMKGMYQATEHYSIFRAAVEYSAVKSTLFNDKLIDRLGDYDRILLVGEAADFCVANSLNDILKKTPELAPRIYVLTDCMSYIIDGNESAKKIFNDAKNLGAHFCKSTAI